MKANQTKPKESQADFYCVGESLWRSRSSGTYYGYVVRNGKQHKTALRTESGATIKDREMADRALADWLAGIGGLVATDDARLTFKDIGERFAGPISGKSPEDETWKTMPGLQTHLKARSLLRLKSCIRNLIPFFGETPIRRVSLANCEAWQSQRGPQLAAQTFAHELKAMRGVLAYAVKHGLLMKNPAVEIKRKPIKKKRIKIEDVPTHGDLRALVAALRKSDGRKGSQSKSSEAADLVEFLAFSGARIGEANLARWSDANWEQGSIWIHGEKASKTAETVDREVPLSGHLRSVLERVKDEATERGIYSPTGPIFTVKDCKTAIRNACGRLWGREEIEGRKIVQGKKKKIKGPLKKHFTHHDFRHYFATSCIEAGVDIPTISRWLGHQDGGVLAMSTYGHLRRDHSFDMIKRVSFGEPTATLPRARDSHRWRFSKLLKRK